MGWRSEFICIVELLETRPALIERGVTQISSVEIRPSPPISTALAPMVWEEGGSKRTPERTPEVSLREKEIDAPASFFRYSVSALSNPQFSTRREPLLLGSHFCVHAASPRPLGFCAISLRAQRNRLPRRNRIHQKRREPRHHGVARLFPAVNCQIC